MFLELIATFAAGAGAAGVVLLLNKLTRGRLPKWAMPVAAGLAMLGVTISNEYTWGARTTNGLPDGVEVVDTVARTAWYQPWTFVVPQVNRIVALDTATIQSNPDAPGVLLVELYLFARWRPVAQVPQLVRCTDPARADVTDAALADPAAANWRAEDGTLIDLACKEQNDG